MTSETVTTRIADAMHRQLNFSRDRSRRIHTAREILIAAADIAGQLGDSETEKKLERLADRAEAKEVYPL